MATKQEALAISTEYFKGDELAASVFVGKYALKDGDNYIETSPDQMHRRLAKEFARIEAKYPNGLTEAEIYDAIAQFGYIVPQGSPMSAIGNNYQVQSASNCYVISSTLDSMGGIHRNDEEQAQLMKRRGGVGHDISNIRPKNLPTANAAGTTDGIGVFMDRFSNTTREVAQNGRRGALMLTCSVHHPEIDTFINIKKDKSRVTGANISVRLSDEFMEAVVNNTEYEQRFPVDSETPTITKKVNARDVWNTIVMAAWESAEPGLLFWDNAMKYTPGDIYKEFGFGSTSTNPCGEIILPPFDSCRLIAENLIKFVINPFTKDAYFDWDLFEKYTIIAQRLMDDLIDIELEQIDKILAKIESDPEPDSIKSVEKNLWLKIRAMCDNGRRTGLGITALGDTLAALGIKYGSDESIEVTEKIYRALAVGAYTSSIILAKERGAFPIFDASLEKGHPFIERILAELDPTTLGEYYVYGRRNIALTTTAPTGSVSMMTQTTSGIEPAFMLKYSRRKKVNSSDLNVKVDYVDAMGDKWQMFDVYHHGFEQWMKVNNKTWDDVEESPYFQATSAEIDWMASVHIQSVAQKWICHSISKTCNLPNSATKELVAQVYLEAWKSGCKGFTVYRDGCREGVLVSSDKKEEVKSEPNLLTWDRPEKLPCDIHHVNISGQSWIIFVGKSEEGIPCELFGGLSSKVVLPKKLKHGFIVKTKHKKGDTSVYDLTYGEGEDKSVIKDIGEIFENATQGDFTRAFSLMLRAKIPIHLIVNQMQKNEASDMYSFSRVVARVLKKYIKDGTTIKGKCPNCGSEDIAYIEGCLTCSSCGNSKCS